MTPTATARRTIAMHGLTLLVVALVSSLPRAALAQTTTSLAASSTEPKRTDAHESHWDLSLDLGGTSAKYALQRHDISKGELGAFTDAKLTRYLNPVIDDGSPRSLQPFLQRTSTLLAGIGFEITHVGAHYISALGGQQISGNADYGPRAQIAADIYALPWLAVTGGFDYDYDRNYSSHLKLHHFGPHAGLGVRLGDTRVDASYAFDAYDETSAYDGHYIPPIRWGTVSLDLESVIARRLAIRLGVQGFDGGEGGSGSLAYYFTPNIGLSLGGFGYRGRVYQTIDNAQIVHNDYGLTGGVDWWVNRVVDLAVDDQLSGTTIPKQVTPGGTSLIPSGTSLIANRVTLRASFRL